jgi:hypothetical protein
MRYVVAYNHCPGRRATLSKPHGIRPGGTPADQGRNGASATAGGATAAGGSVAGKPVAGADKPKGKSLFAAVRHDDRGNAVLQWASDTARHAVVSTSSLLKRLDVSSLSLEDTLDEKRRRADGQPSFSLPAAAPKARTTAQSAAPGKAASVTAGAAKGVAAGSAAGPGAAKRTGSTAPRPGTRPAARSSWWRRLFERR